MYKIIKYLLDLGSYERLNTGMIIPMTSYSSIFSSGRYEDADQWSTVAMAR